MLLFGPNNSQENEINTASRSTLQVLKNAIYKVNKDKHMYVSTNIRTQNLRAV